jgi:hypothetical protein
MVIPAGRFRPLSAQAWMKPACGTFSIRWLIIGTIRAPTAIDIVLVQLVCVYDQPCDSRVSFGRACSCISCAAVALDLTGRWNELG